MKLTYRRCGDYYLPNIGIPAEDMRPLGKYGRMRMRYLREHRSLLFNQLLLSGKLMKHLYSIDDACQERLDLLIPQMQAAEGVTEELKSADQMEWVRQHEDRPHHLPHGPGGNGHQALFDGDILEYNNTWYRIGEGHKAYNPDKTADEDFYILTLASIAAELSTEQITEANVYLALGLPTTWTGRQREEYRRYMMRNPDVRTFNDMLYSIHLTDCIVFPQGHAALVPLMDNDKRFNEFRQFTGTVALRLQQMLPAYLAGYSAGTSAPAAVTVPPVNVTPLQVATTSTQQESDDAMPDFGDSCMDFDFIGG